jgi:(R)-2-hydroxyacyl-CoA dehydratese activating ATPase
LRIAGIDVGSRYIKLAVLENGTVRYYREETGYDPLRVCEKLIDHVRPDRMLATGYGRHLLAASNKTVETVTEIKAVARGARNVFPACRTIIDIGGQDTKVVVLDPAGTVANFEMNDRCAAGTGKFLEIMAHALGYTIGEFGTHCDSDQEVTISSLCAVFAESEVISLISKGATREAMAKGLHSSIVSRILPLVKRIGFSPDVVFAGGCARNVCLQTILAERLGKALLVHHNPDMLSAHGAALCSQDSLS